MIEYRCPVEGIRIQNGNEIHHTMTIIKHLRARGVPVTGHVSIRGVDTGRLEMFTDARTKELVFRYTPPINDLDDEDEEL